LHSADDKRPSGVPIRLRGTVVTLFTAIHDARPKEKAGEGSIGNRITGAE
jgi:hypothetical protein